MIAMFMIGVVPSAIIALVMGAVDYLLSQGSV